MGHTNPRTRCLALEAVGAILADEAANHRRTLVGFDFPYGYPAGFAAALGLPQKPWRAVWNELGDLIHDDERNRNNRFVVASDLNRRLGPGKGPFWACPSSKETQWLSARKPLPPDRRFEELRLTDRRIHGPQPPWKLFTTGSVGSQALVGIPCVAQLRDEPRFATVSRVWPFETGLRAPDFSGYCLVHAEIYPSLITVKPVGEQIKDALQVEGLVRYFANMDEAGELAALFEGPPGLTSEQRRQVEDEEGWILGVQ